MSFSGEAAFRSMMNWLVYTKEPMARRLHRLNTPVTMLYPEDHSFVPSIPDDELECLIGPLCRLKIIVRATYINNFYYLSSELQIQPQLEKCLNLKNTNYGAIFHFFADNSIKTS